MTDRKPRPLGQPMFNTEEEHREFCRKQGHRFLRIARSEYGSGFIREVFGMSYILAVLYFHQAGEAGLEAEAKAELRSIPA